ncbi:MAG TPA: TonB-dependent receptor [Thermoanaerobaculia bacterium]|jgi:hypothetical protein|nr:TonB-dependent receptor [Thermoanaerobaculia bacterium]
MRVRNFVLSLAAAVLVTAPVLAQGIPTGTLAGRVTSAGEALPGVTVTVTSPALQGSRTTTTSSIGDYNVPLLPPGDYKVTFELEGFQRVEKTVKLSAAQNSRADADLNVATVSEEIVVTGTYDTISTQSEASTTFEKEFVESLPMERNIRETVLLTPGVAAGGPGGGRARGITISGAQSYENLFLVNGVVVNENLRGQPFNLFIEDAIQETTVSTSGVSAEFGRFSGGVVNTITKSGGNELSGSFRTNFTNNSWEAETPLTVSQLDTVNKRYEATLGGWVIKDRLWYFLAGRDFKESSSGQTTLTRVPYPIVNDEQRYEGKLTVSPFQGHRLIGSYIKIDREEQGNIFGNVLDLASVVNRALPQDILAVNYSGVITDNFFIEAQYSKREFTFENSGSRFTDRINGTLLVDFEGNRFNSPTFCGVCSPEERNNENTLAKASWFLSTDNVGSHDLSFGYDTFDDVRLANNHQSGSDFRIFLTDTIRSGANITPIALGDDTTLIVWNPIFVESRGTSFKTNSLFVNDRWRLNEHWSFNIGARYDKNDGENSEGQTVADDAKVSPRVGVSYDLKGDGDWIFNASYGEYVSALANTQGDATSRGGNPATFVWFYRGPDIDGTVPTAEALRRIFDWFDSQGGVNNVSNLAQNPSIPGGTSVITDSLISPSVTEYSAGLSKRIGTRGVVRAEYVHRDATDFYFDRINLGTGRATTPTGGLADLAVVGNDDSILERTYDGLHTQFQFRAWDRLNIGGSYTLSRSYGNVDGETSGSGPVRAAAGDYPEYRRASWNYPKGSLNNDARHRARIFGVLDIWKNEHNQLSVGLLQSFTSGTPYGAVGAVDPRDTTGAFGIANPGYVRPPSTVSYYFTDRDAFHTDDITSTDLTLNYSFSWNALGKDVEIFLQPEVLNVFNEQGVISVNQSVSDWTTNRALARFNPFTQTPVEGVNWRKGPNFGRPVNETDYQQPRTYRFSVGLRF